MGKYSRFLLNEYDVRQIILIQKKIHIYECKQLSLYDLVNDLIGILSVLGSVPNSWKDDFQVKINNLEYINECIEDSSISRWKGNYKEDIKQSVTELKEMSILIIDEYLQHSDPNILESFIEVSPICLMCPKCTDIWESGSKYPMSICPNCEYVFNNPLSHKNLGDF